MVWGAVRGEEDPRNPPQRNEKIMRSFPDLRKNADELVGCGGIERKD
jgi:hypothetical protein